MIGPIAVAFILLGMPTAFAQASELDRCMGAANTQTAMTKCASEEAKRVDGQLNSIYQRVLRAADGDALAVTKIRTAERAWLSYRDAYIEAMYPAKDKQVTYGSKFPMDADLLYAALTKTQVEALKKLLEQHSVQR